MKIEFTHDTNLVVVTDFDEVNDNILGEVEEYFTKGEEVECDIIEGGVKGWVDLQFGDGSVAHGVNRDCFVILNGRG